MTTMSIMNLFCLKLIQSIFLIYLVLQADQLVCSKEVVRCIQSERQALLQFKSGLVDEFGMLSSWTTEDCCQWKGVGCSNITGHVLMLDLHGDYDYDYDYAYDYDYLSNHDGNTFYIRGDIHKSLMELQQLQYLNLNGNNFEESNIPGFIGSLRNLRYLDLSYCNFGGQIPIQLESLSHLKYLNLSNNLLDGLIPHRLGDLSNLQFLDLNGNGLAGSIPFQLGNLSNLQFLDLSNNDLERSIPSQLGKLTSLQELYLGKYYSSLTIENADHNGGPYVGFGEKYELNAFLTWKGVEHVFNNNGLVLLKVIDLSSNHFSEEIPPEIADLIQLVSLNLSRNNFTGKIPSNIGKLTSLDSLDLSRNKLLGSIPSSLSQIDRLGVLDLSHNQLSGEIPKSTQLQGFDPSWYEDNLDLCGPPLVKLCVEGKPAHEPKAEVQEDEDLLLNLGFYISLTLGFIIGFWGVFGSILIKRSWRHAYFKFMNNLVDTIYVKCRWGLKA